MNILFVTHAPPVASGDGAQLIVANLGRELAAEHTLYLATLADGEPLSDEVANYFAAVRYGRTKKVGRSQKWAQSLREEEPLWVRAYESAELREGIGELLDMIPIDVAHCDTGLMAPYADALRNVPRVVAPHDSLAKALELQVKRAPTRAKRLAAWLQFGKMRRFEARTYAAFARVIVVSGREGAYLQALAPTLNVCVIPNGVNTTYFAPVAIPVAPKSIGFVGAMDYALNQAAAQHFVQAVLPQVWKDVPEATFTIIGRNPPQAIQALAQDRRIHVTGTLDDIRPAVAAQSVVVCPMQDPSGIKNKMLEALAMGKAIVASPEAADGLDVRAEVEFIQAGNDSEMAKECVRLLENEAARVGLGNAARRWALGHTWGATAQAYEAVYRQVSG